MAKSFIHKITDALGLVFNHNASPLRHIPNIATRHFVMQILGFMWAVSFSIAIGGYTFLAASIIGHAALITAVAITLATFTVAKKNPTLFTNGSGRRVDGEHE
jgi:hypothetical protein